MSYLQYISLLKAQLVTFRGAEVVKSHCFHPGTAVLTAVHSRSMWGEICCPQSIHTQTDRPLARTEARSLSNTKP